MTDLRPSLDPIEQLSPGDAVARIDDGAVLLDVRTPVEWSAGHAPQARWIPLDEIEARVGELDPSISVVAVCKLGGRSQAAADFLSSRGFHVANLVGGMTAWAEAGFPVEDDGGMAGTII
jgi:rhodanese-related sulfurtransferase